MAGLKKVTLNKEQKLYVIPCGNGYSCYGFDYLITMRNKLANELSRPDLAKARKGTLKAYKEHSELQNVARKRFEETKVRCESGLNEKLKGLEGKRVEVVYTSGEKERFYVGRSTGCIPCHLVIKKINSIGGASVTSDENIKSVKVIY